MEILIVGIIMIFLFNYLNLFNFNKFVSDNKSVFNKLKEDDYEFLLVAKYGDKRLVLRKYTRDFFGKNDETMQIQRRPCQK